MQSRDTRFSLRIESGERQGEVVALAVGVTTVGRRPDAGLVLADASVSGRHAELRVGEEGVEVVDVGSTNGTRIDGHKIETAHLSAGDTVVFGNVKVTVQDAQTGADDDEISLEEPAPPARSTPPVAAAPSENLGRVSADALTRSAAGARRWPLFVLLAALIGGGAFATMRYLGGGEGGSQAASVAAVPGNLLADGSFETGDAEWTAAEAAPVGFVRDRAHARSGQIGMGVVLEGQDWSLTRSPEFAVHPRKRLRLGADLRVTGAAVARVGLRLSSSTDALAPMFAWTPATGAQDDFEIVQLAFDTFGEYDRARVAVAARGAGEVSIDDVSVLEEDPAGDAARFNEYELGVLGTPGSNAALVRSGRVVLAGIGLDSWKRSGLAGWAEARLGARASETGFVLSFPGAPRDAELGFVAIRPPAGAGSASEAGWAATTGPDGYAAHGTEFARENVTGLLLGNGSELLRVSFRQPVTVTSAAVEGAQSVRVALNGAEECELQLTFVAERVEAATRMDRAEEAERAGDLGAALQAWSELLDRFPFEHTRVRRAEAARARLVQDGLARVEDIRRELQRARFFGLAELYREQRHQAEALAEQYRGSEVEPKAREVAALALAEEQSLATGGSSDTAEILAGVLGALDPAAAPRLSQHVESALQAANQATGER
jgi:hypothetical protein